jgi:hypothetical protein
MLFLLRPHWAFSYHGAEHITAKPPKQKHLKNKEKFNLVEFIFN